MTIGTPSLLLPSLLPYNRTASSAEQYQAKGLAPCLKAKITKIFFWVGHDWNAEDGRTLMMLKMECVDRTSK